jgi:hypothetical protein
MKYGNQGFVFVLVPFATIQIDIGDNDLSGRFPGLCFGVNCLTGGKVL